MGNRYYNCHSSTVGYSSAPGAGGSSYNGNPSIGGSRQVGKTTVALNILGADEQHPAYLNWDFIDDKRLLLQGGLPLDQPLVILGEIHKYKQ